MDNLNNTLRDLELELKENLVNYIKSKGHQGKGKLINSIQVSILQNEGKPTLRVTGNNYILFLDNGMFIDGWIRQMEPIIENKLGDALVKDILDQLDLI